MGEQYHQPMSLGANNTFISTPFVRPLTHVSGRGQVGMDPQMVGGDSLVHGQSLLRLAQQGFSRRGLISMAKSNERGT